MVSQIGQVVLLRELLMVFYGSELSIGIILASWMFWVGVGSWAGTVLAERVRRPLPISAVAAAGVLLMLPATVLGSRLLRGFFDVVPGEYLSFSATALGSILLMAPGCLLIGVQFVFFARLWREQTGARDTSGGAKTYLFEAWGDAIAGTLFSLLLVHYLNPFHLVLGAAALMAATVAGLGIRAAIREPGRRTVRLVGVAVLGLLVVAAAGSLPFLGRLDALAYQEQWRLFAPDQELVETRRSKYGTISVVRREDQYSFFQSGHLAFSTAEEDAVAYQLEESPAAEFAHFALAQHRAPGRILLVGGGLRGVLREILRHPVVEQVDYVEPDVVMVETASRYVPRETRAALASERVRIIPTDGRLFVKETDRTYDLILVDVPDPATAVLNRFYTTEFFQEASDRLEPDGVLVTGVTSTSDLRGSAVVNQNATVYHTLRTAFDHVLPVGDLFCYFFASNDPDQISADPEVLRHRFAERAVEAEAFSEWYYHTLLEEAPLLRRHWILLHHGRHPEAHRTTPETGPLFPASIADQLAGEADLPPVYGRYFINSDFRPIGYYHSLVLWNRRVDRERAEIFRRILNVRGWWIWPIIGGFLFLQLVLRAAGRRLTGRADAHYAVLFTIFTTGLATMTLQITLLFAFQSIYGFVYEMIGLIVAMFMAGLGLGAALTRRRALIGVPIRLLALIQLCIAAFAFIIAMVLPLAAAAGATWITFLGFSVITFGGGLMNGAGFPLAAACCMGLNRRTEKSTGIAYGTELFGACVGAVLAGAVVAPVIGILACCVLAGIMNSTAFVLILMSRNASWKTNDKMPQPG